MAMLFHVLVFLPLVVGGVVLHSLPRYVLWLCPPTLFAGVFGCTFLGGWPGAAQWWPWLCPPGLTVGGGLLCCCQGPCTLSLPFLVDYSPEVVSPFEGTFATKASPFVAFAGGVLLPFFLGIHIVCIDGRCTHAH